MNVEATDLQKQRDELRARLLANSEIRDQIAFRAYELYENRRGDNGSALEDWLRAENEIVSSLVEQELRLLSASAEKQGLENPGQASKPRVKREKASQSGAASNSRTTKRKASTRSAAPAASKAVKNEKKTRPTVRKPSDASVRAKEGSELESQPVQHD
jgi:hypothetical protein